MRFSRFLDWSCKIGPMPIRAKPLVRQSLCLFALACVFCPIAASADGPLEAFSDICGDEKMPFQSKVDQLKGSGWVARDYADWVRLRALLEESMTAASIHAHATRQEWVKAQEDANHLAELAAMPISVRKNMGLEKFAPVVMSPTDGSMAILMILDESFVQQDKVQCLYSGPMPTDAKALVDQMVKNGWNEKSDDYIHQYSVDHTTNRAGKSLFSSLLISVLQEESSIYLGSAPISAVEVSIYTQPLNR